MYCRMIRGIYLRCNGELACYCGPGEEVVLGQLPIDNTDYDFVKDYYHNKKHQNVYKSMRNLSLPYPNVCLKCLYLEPMLADGSENRNKEIEWMHIEPTSQCNLKCSFCIPPEQRKKFRKPPYYLNESMFNKVINDISLHNMKVKWMYFSGRGEPGLHRNLWKMVTTAKKTLDTNFLVNTNGNIQFKSEMVECGLDKIKIAIDGINEEKYVRYRKGGKLERILKLSKKLSKKKIEYKIKTPKIIWQYILFSHNDKMSDLIEIQKMAIDHGVDELLFKTTFSDKYSEKSLETIPKIHPSLKVFDIKKMVFLNKKDLEENQKNLDKCIECQDLEKAIGYGLNIVKSVYRSVILGIGNKQNYNDYGRTNSITMIVNLIKDSCDDSEWILDKLKEGIKKLVISYNGLNNEKDANYFENILREIP